MRIYRY